MTKHRVAVIGCGALARGAHLPNCRDNPRTELAVACDIDSETAAAAGRDFGAERVETDWRRVIAAADIDLCILATHTNLRGEFIVPALEHGKPVYTEKPLAPSVPDMRRIVDAVRRTGQPVCVGHNRRSSPAMLEFKRLLDQALAGADSLPPTVDRSTGRDPIPEERQTQLLIRINDDARSWKPWVFADEEGIMFAEMVHFIDLALWLNRSHPVRVFAEGSPRGNFSLILRFGDGSLTTLQHTMVGHFDYPKELFEASTGNITIALEQHLEVRQCGLADEPPVRFFPYAEGMDWAAAQGVAGYFREMTAERTRAQAAGEAPRQLNVDKGHARHLDRFLDHVEGKGANPCPVEGAVAVNRIALKFLDSARLGLPLAINPQDWA